MSSPSGSDRETIEVLVPAAWWKRALYALFRLPPPMRKQTRYLYVQDGQVFSSTVPLSVASQEDPSMLDFVLRQGIKHDFTRTGPESTNAVWGDLDTKG